MAEHIVVGIDVGTTKVVTLIGEVLPDGRVEVIGVGVTPARGLRKGIVVSVEEAVEAIGASVRKAEKDIGVLLIDIGGGTTNAAVFVDGSISHALVLPIGGHHLTNDIAIGIRVPFATAEEIKLRYGSALASAVDDDGPVNGSGRDE